MDFKQLLQNEKNMGKNPAAAYRVENLEEMDRLLFSKRNTPEKLEEIRNQAKELIGQESALALEYVSGRIKLELRPHEFNMDLNNCLISFNNARNWDTADWLGHLIISKSFNATAYRILGAVAHEKGNDELMWENYEKYAKFNHQDKDFIVDVAKHFEEKGDLKASGAMYERGLLRMDTNTDHQKILDCFEGLIRSGKDEPAFFLTYIQKVVFTSGSLALSLYKMLLTSLEKTLSLLKSHKETKPSEIRKTEDDILETIKGVLAIDENTEGAYDKLISAIRMKWAGSPRLEECLKKHMKRTGVLSHLASFEEEIAYAKGVFVLHKSSRRVGRIMKIQGEDLSVMYAGGEPLQNITLSTATETLVPLTNQNIKAIKKGVPAEKIKAKANGDITWLTRTMIYSLTTPDCGTTSCTIRDMKSELVPYVFSEEEWKRTSDLIKQEVKVNPYVRVIPGPTERYELTAFPSTPDEKMLYFFRTCATFYEKAICILESYKRKDIDREGDALLEMAEYFEKMQEQGTVDEQISSALVLETVTDEDDANILITKTFEQIVSKMSMDEKVKAFSLIDSVLVKKAFVDRIVKFDRTAPELLVEMMPYYISYVSQKLKKISKGKYYYTYLKEVFGTWRQHFMEFMYFQSDITDEELEKIGFDRHELIKMRVMAMHHLASQTDNAENRKYMKTLHDTVIKARDAEKLIRTVKDEEAEEIRNLFWFNDGLTDPERKHMRELIWTRWDEFRPVDAPVVKKERKTLSGFLCLSDSYDQKQAELKDLKTVQIPAILKEIAAARELGDLRENSEYQYAKDHKRELERRIGALSADLNTVRIVRADDVLFDMVGFGTKVTLTSHPSEEEVVYTFLGRWESHPEEGIIDINAPIGRALANHLVGDRVTFDINGREHDYTVNKIEVIL